MDELRQVFLRGLERLLDQPALGNYILVHANAGFDPAIWESLQAKLRRRFSQLAADYRQRLLDGRSLDGVRDDILVFLKLMAIGFDGVQPTRFRRAGPWEVQFNHLRAFRPARMSAETGSGVSIPFNPRGFHFNKPFLRRETLWAGRLHGLDADLLYNKFPFVDMHALLVPNRRANEPQFLSRPYHFYIWKLTERLAETLPDVGFGYNSFGAFASVNHLHFQMFLRPKPLPLVSPRWRHNGGSETYPVGCEVYRSARETWERLDALHRKQTSYNLVYLPGLVYCLPRRRQGTYQHAAWTSGFAWFEVSGGITAFNRQDYAIDEESITRELGLLRI